MKLDKKTIYILIIYGAALLCFRMLFSTIEEQIGAVLNDILFAVIILSSIFIFLYLTIKGIRAKRIIPSFVFASLLILIWFVIPFEYFVGILKFKLNSKERMTIVNNLKAGVYDSILIKNNRMQTPAWIENYNKKIKVFRNNSLEMVFIYEGNIRTLKSDFWGYFYISDTSAINNLESKTFLITSDKKYLGNNWFWIEHSEDVTPAE